MKNSLGQYFFNPVFISYLWIVIIEAIGFKFFYRFSWSSAIIRLALLNLYSLSTLAVFSIVGTLYGYWQVILNWSVRDFLLALLLIEFPMAVFALPKSPFKKVFSAIVLVNLMSCLILSFFVVYLPQALMISDKGTWQFEREMKSNFKEIVTALEKFKKEKGHYPPYIYGGQRMTWEQKGNSILDPLINEGYFESYPRNPINLERSFFLPRREPGVIALFFGRKTQIFMEMYDAWYFSVRDDPRFGFHGTKMGNVLSDPNIETSYKYEFFKVTKKGHNSDHNYFLPGSFIYRSFDIDSDGITDACFVALIGGEELSGQDYYDATNDALAKKVVASDGKVKLIPVCDGIPDGIIDVYFGGDDYWITVD